jgi:ATP-binding cassette, subfamily B, bacterial PglK
MKQIFTLWFFLSSKRRRQFYVLLILIFLSSFAEIISLGLTVPFLGVLTAPETIFSSDLAKPILNLMGITSNEDLIFVTTVAFICAAIFAGCVRLLLLYAVNVLSIYTGSDIGVDIYRKTLYQEYSVHIDRNSSEVFTGILKKADRVVAGVIAPFLNIVSSLVIVFSIGLTLFYIDAVIAATTASIFGVFYFFTIRFTHQKLNRNSIEIAHKENSIVKSLQEGLGGIRDILINKSQEFYCNNFKHNDLKMRRASVSTAVIAGSPRYIMEAIGITTIAVLSYILSFRDGGLVSALPVLGALAIGAQRILPLLQQSYHGLSTIRGSLASLEDVLSLLNQPLPKDINKKIKEIPFKSEILIENLSFSYNKNEDYVLKDINLKIERGSCIGFIGATGSGKSTLLDIMMFLLKPTKGSIKVDGVKIDDSNSKSWQQRIAHVPQSIYLSDLTISENIAFGIPKNEIDLKKVKKSAEMAKIANFISNMTDGYDSYIGERGVKLSGGQRQRIGIARALYQNADVLILDESTSALDSKTEEEVMASVRDLYNKITILIVAHRTTTLESCSKIVEIGDRGILSIKKIAK